MSAHAAAAAVTARSGRAVDAPILPWRAARMAAFVPLGAFAALHWALLVEPRAGVRMLAAVAVAAAGGAALDAARHLPGAARHAAAAGLALAMAAGVLLTAGIPLRLLAPGGWGELASGATQGLEALPDIRVPYAGVDPWPRLVLLAGGGLLVVVGAVAAFWPARGRRGASHAVGIVALSVFYAVPAVDLATTHEFLRGAAFAVLLAAFAWLERVPRTAAGGAAVAATAAVGLGLVAAPALDGPRAWIDYERIAESLAPASSTRFDFSHSYGPMDWPRDGREVLRVKARRQAYWKAENLDEFDGIRWRSTAGLSGARTPLSSELPDGFARRRDWIQRIEVTVRSLEGESVVAAGTILDVVDPPSAPVATASPGTYAFADSLERGDSYAADVYVPRPSPRALARAGADYSALSPGYLSLTVPVKSAGRARGLPAEVDVRFPGFGTGGEPLTLSHAEGTVTPADLTLRDSAYARTWALARRLRARSRTPYEYARRVLAHLASGFAYSETPDRRPVPLEAFLFDDRVGYCQHFSGAMALLLRMGGVPARVVGGFSPGSYSRKRKDYVVRDLDAHSWVEAWFPRYGWITFDPTPAASPARSQLINVDLPDATAPPGLGGVPRGGDRPEPGPRADASPAGGRRGPGPVTAILALAGLLAGGTLAVLAVRARRARRSGPDGRRLGDPALAELRRALARSGRPTGAQTTLAALERRFAFDAGAAGYLRSLRERRYGYAGTVPAGGRGDLRRALAHGLGVPGRLRAWWALPPRPRRWTRSLH